MPVESLSRMEVSYSYFGWSTTDPPMFVRCPVVERKPRLNANPAFVTLNSNALEGQFKPNYMY